MGIIIINGNNKWECGIGIRRIEVDKIIASKHICVNCQCKEHFIGNLWKSGYE